jgi:hypothetical protein
MPQLISPTPKRPRCKEKGKRIGLARGRTEEKITAKELRGALSLLVKCSEHFNLAEFAALARPK